MDTALRLETEIQAREAPEQTRTLVVLGDSIAYGWGLPYEQSFPAVLEGLLTRDTAAKGAWRVINAGVPGDTALMGCARYARDVTPFAPQIVVLCFGLNDAALRRTQFDAQRERLWQAQHCPWMRLRVIGERFLPHGGEVRRELRPRVRPRLFVAALRELVRRARREGAVVYLLSMTPALGQGLTPQQRQLYERYNELIRKAARREEVALVDLRDAQLAPFLPATMLAEDGIHLTASGQEWLANSLYGCLIQKRL